MTLQRAIAHDFSYNVIIRTSRMPACNRNHATTRRMTAN